MSECPRKRGAKLGSAFRAAGHSKVAGRLSTVRRREDRGSTPDDMENTELKMLTLSHNFDQDVRHVCPCPDLTCALVAPLHATA